MADPLPHYGIFHNFLKLFLTLPLDNRGNEKSHCDNNLMQKQVVKTIMIHFIEHY